MFKKILYFSIVLTIASCSDPGKLSDVQTLIPENIVTVADESVFIENYNGTGINVAVHNLNEPGTRTSGDGQWQWIVIENGVYEVSFKLRIVELSPGVTHTTHFADSGETIASFLCEYGNVIEIEVPEGDDPAGPMYGWIKDWKDCTKKRYGEMMDIINNNEDSEGIANGNNTAVPLITEAAVAIAAGIHCLDKDNW